MSALRLCPKGGWAFCNSSQAFFPESIAWHTPLAVRRPTTEAPLGATSLMEFVESYKGTHRLMQSLRLRGRLKIVQSTRQRAACCGVCAGMVLSGELVAGKPLFSIKCRTRVKAQ